MTSGSLHRNRRNLSGKTTTSRFASVTPCIQRCRTCRCFLPLAGVIGPACDASAELVEGLRRVGSSGCSKFARKIKSAEQCLSRLPVAQLLGFPQQFRELRRLAPSIVRSMFPFVFFLIIYGLNHRLHVQPLLGDLKTSVHLNTIMRVEETVFSFLPHEIVSAASHPALDLMAAVPYLMHYSLPVIFPLYLFLLNRTSDIPRFYWLLGTSCWLSYLVWWAFPHAPPWVLVSKSNSSTVEEFQGFLHELPSADLPSLLEHKEGTAFRRLDERFGLHFFYGLFFGSPVPFACFPSGHLAWTFCMFTVGAPGGYYFLCYVIWMAWATMYSYHHYLSDVFAGVAMVLICDRWMRLLGCAWAKPPPLPTEISAPTVLPEACGLQTTINPQPMLSQVTTTIVKEDYELTVPSVQRNDKIEKFDKEVLYRNESQQECEYGFLREEESGMMTTWCATAHHQPSRRPSIVGLSSPISISGVSVQTTNCANSSATSTSEDNDSLSNSWSDDQGRTTTTAAAVIMGNNSLSSSSSGMMMMMMMPGSSGSGELCCTPPADHHLPQQMTTTSTSMSRSSHTPAVPLRMMPFPTFLDLGSSIDGDFDDIDRRQDNNNAEDRIISDLGCAYLTSEV